MVLKLNFGIFAIFVMGYLQPGECQTTFKEISDIAGIHFDYVGFHYGGGIAVGDFNADGFEDLYVTNGNGKPNALFLNNGNGTFSDVAAAAGVADTLEGMGTVCADIDNDGDLDIFVSNHNAANRLYLNDGNATFTDVAATAGLAMPGPSTSVALADIDNDGWLDIYVLNHSQDHVEHSNTLYLNNRNGTFSDITETSGAGSTGTSLAVGFFDFNNDLFPDIYVVNEYQRDELIVNNGDGTFTNLRDEVVIPFGGGMGVDFADYDNDGDLDVYVSNLYRDFLLRNDDGNTLTDVTSASGIENLTMGWGVSFLDYDNDGDRDLHVVNGAMLWPNQYSEKNVFFRNNGNGFFNEVSAQLGLDTEGDSRASVCADFDNNGAIDIAVLNVERGEFQLFNNQTHTNNWIRIRLVGSRSNYCGIGAKVVVKTGGDVQMHEIRAGSSYASNHSLLAAFGLKKAAVIDEINVQWPSGESQTLTDVAVNQILTITEPGTRPVNGNIATQFKLLQNFPNPFNPTTEIPFRLITEGQPTLQIFDVNGKIVWQKTMPHLPAGNHSIEWNGRDSNGKNVSSGVYFYTLQFQSAAGADSPQIHKMILIR